MSQVFNKLYLDVRTETTDIVTAIQNDTNSRFLDVFLLNNGLPIDLTGHDVRMYGVKGDTTEFYNDGEITEATNGRCQFELTSQALAVAKDVKAQVIIYYNNVQILQTLPFTIHVVESLLSDNAIPSSNEYGSLVVLYQNFYEAHDLMTTMVQNQGTKSAISTERNIDTFWQVLEYVAKYMDTNLTDLLNYVLQNADVIGVINRLGETDDTGGTETAGTVFGKLNTLLGYKAGVKSIQRVTGTSTYDQSATSYSISSVNSARCVVLFDRLENTTTALASISYTLSNSSLVVNYPNWSMSSGERVSYGFWIIEFY